MHKSRLLILIVLLFFLSESVAQNALKHSNHSIILKTQFFQIKEGFNYGLVFNGLNVCGRYTFEKSFNNSMLSYAPGLSFGANYNRGIGMSWGLTPVDLFYGVDINKNASQGLFLGPYVSTIYSWQLYPELQSGHMFWFTSFELGPRLIGRFPILNKKVNFRLSSSVAGFNAHSKPVTETYYYALAFSDFVGNAHEQMEFGTLNVYNHTNLEVELVNNTPKRLSLAYEFEYFGYFRDIKFELLAHSLNLKWKIGKL